MPAENRRTVRSNRTARILRFSRMRPENPGKSPKARNDDLRSSELTDLGSNGRIVKSFDYRYTCTGTRHGTRNRSNGRLGWIRIPSTISMNHVGVPRDNNMSQRYSLHRIESEQKTKSVEVRISKGIKCSDFVIIEAKNYHENSEYVNGYVLQIWVVTISQTYKKFRPRNFR